MLIITLSGFGLFLIIMVVSVKRKINEYKMNKSYNLDLEGEFIRVE